MAKAIDLLKGQIEKAIEECFSRKNMQEIADFSASLIRVRTGLGFGVDAQGQSRKRLAPLADKTISARQRMQLSGKTSPSRSNLTETGQMLEGVQGRVTGPRTAVIEIVGNRKEDSSISNDDVREFNENPKPTRKLKSGKTIQVNKPPRKFFNFSNLELKQIEDEVRKTLINCLNRRL